MFYNARQKQNVRIQLSGSIERVILTITMVTFTIEFRIYSSCFKIRYKLRELKEHFSSLLVNDA